MDSSVIVLDPFQFLLHVCVNFPLISCTVPSVRQNWELPIDLSGAWTLTNARTRFIYPFGFDTNWSPYRRWRRNCGRWERVRASNDRYINIVPPEKVTGWVSWHRSRSNGIPFVSKRSMSSAKIDTRGDEHRGKRTTLVRSPIDRNYGSCSIER